MQQRRRSPAFDPAAGWAEFETLLRSEYAYIDRTDFDVDAYLDRVEALALTSETADELRSILNRATYAFTDPHLIIGPLTDNDFNVIPTSSDLWMESREDGVFVIDVRQGSAAVDAGIMPGWELVSVNGASVDTQLAAVFGGLMASPTVKQKSYAASLLANGKRDADRQLVFSDKGVIQEISLPSPQIFARIVNERPPVSTNRSGPYGIIRVNNSLGDNETITAFDEAVRDLADTEAIIIDLRNTPSGGNTETARSIIGHFITEVHSYQVHEIPALERAFTVPRRFIEQAYPRDPGYDGPVLVLGGRWTGSMGEGLVIGLHAAAGAVTITSDMADLLGGLWNRDFTTFPARMDFGGETLLHVDGTPREDYIGDILLTSADTAPDGTDPAMAAALAWLQDADIGDD